MQFNNFIFWFFAITVFGRVCVLAFGEFPIRIERTRASHTLATSIWVFLLLWAGHAQWGWF